MALASARNDSLAESAVRGSNFAWGAAAALLLATIPDRWVAFAGAVLLCIMWAGVTGRYFRRPLGLTGQTALLIALSFSITMLAPIEIVSLIRGLMYLARPIVFIYLGYAVASRLSDASLLRLVAAIGACASAYYLYRYVAASGASLGRYELRSQVGAGSLIIWLVPVCVVCLWHRSSAAYKALGVVLAVLSLTALLVSDSRSGFLFLALFFVIANLPARVLSALPSLLMIISLAILFISTPLGGWIFGVGIYGLVPVFFSEMITPTISDWAAVNEQWRGFEANAAFQYAAADWTRLLFGGGLESNVPLGVSIDLGGRMFQSIDVFHNVYSLMIVRGGLLGVALYLLQIHVLAKALAARRKVSGAWLIGLTCLVFMTVSAPTIQGLFNAGPTGALAALMIGSALRSADRTRQEAANVV